MLSVPNHLLRQSELVSLSILPTPITVIGAGAIGSFVVLNLAKMGFSDITVYDFDQVDDVNLSSQFYRHSDIGKPKVDALRDLIRDFTGIEIKAVNDKYVTGVFDGVVISAVDSMAVRKTIWENHYLKSFATKIVIDPRMSAEFAALYCANPLSADDNTRYSKTLYSDDEAVAERCTAKATMYTVGMISGLVARTVRDVLSGKEFVQTVQWSIPEDDMMVWRSEGTNNLPVIPKPERVRPDLNQMADNITMDRYEIRRAILSLAGNGGRVLHPAPILQEILEMIDRREVVVRYDGEIYTMPRSRSPMSLREDITRAPNSTYISPRYIDQVRDSMMYGQGAARVSGDWSPDEAVPSREDQAEGYF